MFTGIVEELGIVSAINRTRAGVCLKIRANIVSSDVKIGDSIAINGTCLSVVAVKGTALSFDVINETFKRTTLGQLKINDSVNLERSLKADSRMGGHFVSGHIDYKGKIVDTIKGSEGTSFKISIPAEFSKFVVEKGSIALDGISLTVANIARETFTTCLIPHTLKVTTFGKKQKGDFLNVETDLLAKYLAKQTQKPSLENVLKKYNYI